jgi:hypothetical protein
MYSVRVFVLVRLVAILVTAHGCLSVAQQSLAAQAHTSTQRHLPINRCRAGGPRSYVPAVSFSAESACLLVMGMDPMACCDTQNVSSPYMTLLELERARFAS